MSTDTAKPKADGAESLSIDGFGSAALWKVGAHRYPDTQTTCAGVDCERSDYCLRAKKRLFARSTNDHIRLCHWSAPNTFEDYFVALPNDEIVRLDAAGGRSERMEG